MEGSGSNIAAGVQSQHPDGVVVGRAQSARHLLSLLGRGVDITETANTFLGRIIDYQFFVEITLISNYTTVVTRNWNYKQT